MNIQPTRPGQTRGPAPERPDDAATIPVRPDRSDRGVVPEPLTSGGDRVELSQSARDLQHPAPATPKIYSISEARMKNVLQRLAEGFYDRPEIREDVLRRLFADLEAGPTR